MTESVYKKNVKNLGKLNVRDAFTEVLGLIEKFDDKVESVIIYGMLGKGRQEKFFFSTNLNSVEDIERLAKYFQNHFKEHLFEEPLA